MWFVTLCQLVQLLEWLVDMLPVRGDCTQTHVEHALRARVRERNLVLPFASRVTRLRPLLA